MSNENQTVEREIDMTDSTMIARRDNLEAFPGLLNASDEASVKALEKIAENAPRVVNAINKALVAVAQKDDWMTHDGETASLSSAGAERFLKLFPMQFTNWEREKQEWSDGEGDAYRWTYRCTVRFNGSELMAEGKFSTRDKLLGYKNDSYRPLEEIDESDIMSAARHICIGEGIKAHLGLRGMKIDALKSLGVDVKNIKSAGYQRGGQGGAPEASSGDKLLQGRLRKMCLELSDGDMLKAADHLESASAFTGRDGKHVKGKKNAAYLTGKRLEITYGTVKNQFIERFGQEAYDEDIEGGGDGN